MKNKLKTLKEFSLRLASISELNGLRVYDTYTEEYGYISDDNISNWDKIGSHVFISEEVDGEVGYYANREDIRVVEE